jgi:hypothetical protein
MRFQDACRIEVRGARVFISGDLDLLTSKNLRRAIAALASDEVDLDLGGAVFLGWPGLEVLLEMRLDHPSVRISAASDRVWHMLDASGTSALFTGSRHGGGSGSAPDGLCETTATA